MARKGEIAGDKSFEHKRYFFYGTAQNKRDAEKLATKARRRGGLARIYRMRSGNIPYVVYAKFLNVKR